MITGFKESVQIGIIYGWKPVRFMCSHCCLYRRRQIPNRLNNELLDWSIGKTVSQSEIVFKGQLGSVLQTPRAEYCTVQQFIGSAIDRQAHFNSEKYIILKLYSIKQKNTLYQVIIRDYYMTFSISALVLARDSHIKPDSETGGLIWVEG